MADPTPDVLLVASGDWLASGRLPGLLAAAGCRVMVLCPPRQMALRSRHVDGWIPAERSSEAVVEALRLHLQHARYAWIVVADGPTLRALGARRHEPWVGDWCPVDPRGPHVDLLFSKIALCQVAQAWGLPVPRSRVCRTADEAAAAAEEIGLPVMVKEDGNQAGEGVRPARDRRALDEILAQPWRPSVVQELVPGRDLPVEAFYDRGALTCWVSSYRERAWPDPYGPSTARRYVSVPAVRTSLEIIGRRTGFHGFASFDFREEARTGHVRLLEMDGRPTPCLHLGRRVGADFALAVRRMLAGARPAEPLHQRADRAPMVYMFPHDPVRSIAGGHPASLLPWLFDARRWVDIPVADPPLLNAYARYLLRATPVPRLLRRARAGWERLARRQEASGA